MTERSFVDTNILVHRIDHAEPLKREIARWLLDQAAPGSLVISTQVLQDRLHDRAGRGQVVCQYCGGAAHLSGGEGARMSSVPASSIIR